MFFINSFFIYIIRNVQMWAPVESRAGLCVTAHHCAYQVPTHSRSHQRATRHPSKAVTTVWPTATTATHWAMLMSIPPSSTTPTTITTPIITSAANQYVTKKTPLLVEIVKSVSRKGAICKATFINKCYRITWAFWQVLPERWMRKC